MGEERKARDMALLDALDSLSREQFQQTVWRIVREGRDPLQGSATRSRWGSEGFETLYASLEKDGALAEIHALLSSQPVFPSKIVWHVHQISVELENLLRLPTLDDLMKLGVETERYRHRDYQRTREVADAAYFLGFDGLLVPNARWACLNLVIFTDRVSPSQLVLQRTDPTPIDWGTWKPQQAGRSTSVASPNLSSRTKG